MRLTRSIWGLTLIAAAACSSSLTAPPSGLPVSVTPVPEQSVQVPSITSAGDSVTAAVMETGEAACSGGPLNAAAGVRQGDLVVTLTEMQRKGPCPPEAAAVPLPLVIVVHDVPSGTSSARVVQRLVNGDNATYTVLASGPISIQ